MHRNWITAILILLGFNLTSCENKNQVNGKKLTSNRPPVDTNKYLPIVGEIAVKDSSNHTQNFDAVPEFPGGTGAYASFLQKNINYTKGTPNGRVVIQFTVTKKGDLEEFKILKSLSPLADKEVIRVLNLSPKWNPATNKGRPVNFQYTIPVIFSDK